MRGQRGKQKGKRQTNLSKRSERSDAHFPTLRLFEERTGECRGQDILFRHNFGRPLDPTCGELGLSKFTLVNAFCFSPFAVERSGGGGNVTEGSMRNPEPRNGVLPSCPPPTRSPGRGVGGSHLRSPSPPTSSSLPPQSPLTPSLSRTFGLARAWGRGVSRYRFSPRPCRSGRLISSSVGGVQVYKNIQIPLACLRIV